MSLDHHTPQRKELDFSRIRVDSHLTKDEQRIITEAYRVNKEALWIASREKHGKLRDLITKDYGIANSEALGWVDGIKKLQKVLKVEEDGDFGPETFRALLEYQEASTLIPDAVAGPRTITKSGILPETDNTVSEPSPQTSTVIREINPTTLPEEQVSAIPAIEKFSVSVRLIEERVSWINNHRQENIEPVGVIWDWIGEKTGVFETGKDIHWQQLRSAQVQAEELHSQIIKEFDGRNLSLQERQTVDALITRLIQISGTKLTDVSWGKAVFNHYGIADEQGDDGILVWTVKHALRKTIGVAEPVWSVIAGVADLTIFMGKYAKNLIWENPEQKQCMDEQMEQIWDYIKDTKLVDMRDQVLWTMGQEMLRIVSLSGSEQADASGNFAGNVIMALSLVKAGSAVARYAGKAEKRGVQAKKIAAKSAEHGKNPSSHAPKDHLGKQAGNPDQAEKALSLVWGWSGGNRMKNTLQEVISCLNSPTANIAEKVKMVDVGLEEAMKVHNMPQDLDQYIKAGEIISFLEAKRAGLIAQITAKARAGAWSSGIQWTVGKNPIQRHTEADNVIQWEENTVKPRESGEKKKHPIPVRPLKKFETEWVFAKELFERMFAYYHPRRNSHPQAQTVFDEVKDAYQKSDFARLRSIAENPGKPFNGNKGANDPVPTTPEVETVSKLIERIKNHLGHFSRQHLQSLAESDGVRFGEALLQRDTLQEILSLARTDSFNAMAQYRDFLKNPRQYLAKRYPGPYPSAPSVDSEIWERAQRAYETDFREVWEKLPLRHRQTYEEYLQSQALQNPKVSP